MRKLIGGMALMAAAVLLAASLFMTVYARDVGTVHAQATIANQTFAVETNGRRMSFGATNDTMHEVKASFGRGLVNWSDFQVG